MSNGFKDWFGNSLTVDAAGAPLVLYHGTYQEFTEFQYGEFGFHFGSCEAASECGSILMEVHLHLTNPIIFDTDFSSWNDEEIVGDYLLERGIITEVEMYQGDLQGLLMAKGYDGYVYPNGFEGGGNSYAVFSPEQIKSIYHIGPYDRECANIFGRPVPTATPGAESAPLFGPDPLVDVPNLKGKLLAPRAGDDPNVITSASAAKKLKP